MKHIDKVFKDQLQNHEMNVPDGMWEKIAPAIEKDSGRGVLWFWLAGLLAIALAGALYFAINGSSSSSQLVDNQQIEQDQTNVIENTLVLKETPKSIEENLAENITLDTKVETTIDAHTAQNLSKVDNTNIVSNNSVTKTSSPTITTVPVSNSKENISTDFNSQGQPANIVITKSFISDNGAMIEKSNLNTNGTTTTSPKYNVFINSEGLGVGALMRIVDPVESIELPYLNKPLKKKIVKHQL